MDSPSQPDSQHRERNKIPHLFQRARLHENNQRSNHGNERRHNNSQRPLQKPQHQNKQQRHDDIKPKNFSAEKRKPLSNRKSRITRPFRSPQETRHHAKSAPISKN